MRFTLLSRRTFIAAVLAAGAALPLTQALAAPFASERITVRTEGSGPDVVLIPGLNSSPRTWASTVAAVPGYRYHLVQVSGFAGQPAGANKEGNVAAPVVAYLGVQLVYLVEGVVLVETIFAWPGIGHALVHAIFGRDVPMIQGTALVLGLMFVLFNALVDAACAFIDPRRRP